MSELQRIRESRMDDCMEALEYYVATFLDKGMVLSEQQLKDYKENCAILQCMGEKAKEYSDFMLMLI